MKSLFILSMTFSLIFASTFGQKNPPENVKKEFNTKYASAQSVRWGNEEKNEWEADFKLDGKKMSASFYNSGKWIESEAEITEKELPSEVINSLKNEYPGYKKSLLEIYESPEIKGFEMTLKKGKLSYEVVFNRNGKTIKKTEISQEEEEK